MKIKDFKQQLDTLGIPIAYRQWGKGEEPSLPYILYYRDESNDFIADNKNYFESNQMSLELYSQTKDFELEEHINELLKNLKIPYKIYEGNLDTENMYEVLYEFTI